MKKISVLKFALICCVAFAASCAQASAQQFDFVDFGGNKLLDVTFSLIPGGSSDIESVEFTSLGETFFGLDGSEIYDFSSATSVGASSSTLSILGTDNGLEPMSSANQIAYSAYNDALANPFSERLQLTISPFTTAGFEQVSIVRSGTPTTANGNFALAPAAIPEPSSLLLGLAVAGVLGITRRRIS